MPCECNPCGGIDKPPAISPIARVTLDKNSPWHDGPWHFLASRALPGVQNQEAETPKLARRSRWTLSFLLVLRHRLLRHADRRFPPPQAIEENGREARAPLRRKR
jgi:hypothetical protein